MTWGPGMAELDPKIKIRAPLRCDGIGRLDCAEDVESGSRLAVRWLPLEANGDAAVKACEKLPAHPTLPKILQTGAVGTSAFVAMDFPEGRVLSAMAEERLDVEVVLRIASQVSDALALVHEQGVVHGELSSESVLVVEPDRAYLWDMPLVIANRMTDRRGENRLMQNLPRTAAFLAPERAQGAGASPAGDVYSLGAVLCALAGSPVPTAQTTLGIVHLVASGTWVPRVPTTIPDPWRAVLLRMVASSPSDRPSARDVAQAFARPAMPTMLPTVPEMPAVRLPPELTEALQRKPSESVSTEEAVSVSTEPGAAAAADAAVVAEVVESTPAVATSPTVEVSPSAEPTVITQALPDLQLRPTHAPSSPDVPVVPVMAVPPPPPRADSQEVPEVSGIDVVKLPTIEMPAIQMNTLVSQTQAQSAVASMVVPPAPRLTPMSSTAVKLTDSILVAPELAQAGAVTLTPELYAQLQRPPKWVYALGAAMAVSILILLGIAVHLAAKQAAAIDHANATRIESQSKQVVTPAVTPVKAETHDEELAPLKRTPSKTPARTTNL